MLQRLERRQKCRFDLFCLMLPNRAPDIVSFGWREISFSRLLGNTFSWGNLRKPLVANEYEVSARPFGRLKRRNLGRSPAKRLEGWIVWMRQSPLFPLLDKSHLPGSFLDWLLFRWNYLFSFSSIIVLFSSTSK